MYSRVSGAAQINGDGFPRQQEAIRRYAGARGIEVVGEYRDEGVSGTKDLDHRDGLSDLMARILSSGAWLVLAERADRLAPDLMVGSRGAPSHLPTISRTQSGCSPNTRHSRTNE